jgi:hypothetical protein
MYIRPGPATNVSTSIRNPGMTFVQSSPVQSLFPSVIAIHKQQGGGGGTLELLPALLLLFQKLHSSGSITTVKLRRDILPHSFNRLSGHNLLSYGCLYDDFKQFPLHKFLELGDPRPPGPRNLAAVHDLSYSIHWHLIYKEIEPDNVRLLVARIFVIQRGVTTSIRYRAAHVGLESYTPSRYP